MPYTITITNDSPHALAYVEKAKKLDLVKVTEIKKPKKVKSKVKTAITEPTFSKEVLEAAKVLKMTPDEIVAAANEQEMTPDDYVFIMMISEKINHNIAKRWDEHFNLY